MNNNIFEIRWKLSNLVENDELSKLSDLTEIPYITIKKIYMNKLFQFDLDVLTKLCYFLNCDINDLLEIDNK